MNFSLKILSVSLIRSNHDTKAMQYSDFGNALMEKVEGVGLDAKVLVPPLIACAF